MIVDEIDPVVSPSRRPSWSHCIASVVVC